MKKIIALVVALVMMAAMAVPAFAADFVGGTEISANAGGTQLVYGTSQRYTVTIPPQIELEAGSNSASQPVSISNYKLAVGKRVSISINSANADEYYTSTEGNGWFLVEATGAEYTPVAKASKKAADVPYTVYNGGTQESNKVLRGATIVYADSTADLNPTAQTTNLVFYTAGTSEVADFTDTVSFLATVGDKPQA